MSEFTVIVGYDGMERGKDAIVLGAMLARQPKARLIVAHAHAGGDPAFARLLHEGVRLIPYGVRVQTRALLDESPASALARLAEEERAELVVVGSSPRGHDDRLHIGGVGGKLLRDLSCGLALAPHDFKRRF